MKKPACLVYGLLAVLFSGAALAEEPPPTNWSPVCWSSCWRPPNTFEKISLIGTEALLLADVLMTIDFMHRSDEYSMGEINPIASALFGRHPSGWRIAGVGVGGMLLTAALWYALPPFWRNEATLTIAAFEIWNVADMYSVGIRFRLP